VRDVLPPESFDFCLSCEFSLSYWEGQRTTVVVSLICGHLCVVSYSRCFDCFCPCWSAFATHFGRSRLNFNWKFLWEWVVIRIVGVKLLGCKRVVAVFSKYKFIWVKFFIFWQKFFSSR
jgi:hypothetical protein